MRGYTQYVSSLVHGHPELVRALMKVGSDRRKKAEQTLAKGGAANPDDAYGVVDSVAVNAYYEQLATGATATRAATAGVEALRRMYRGQDEGRQHASFVETPEEGGMGVDLSKLQLGADAELLIQSSGAESVEGALARGTIRGGGSLSAADEFKDLLDIPNADLLGAYETVFGEPF
jgi:hypothetical protein